MNDLALVLERYGRVGTIERLLPEFITPTDINGKRECCWPSAVGMVRINRIEDLASRNEISNELLASIIVTKESGKYVEMVELHGVSFFVPIDGLKWEEQIHSMKTRPSMFEILPVDRLQASRDYAFFARRAAKTTRLLERKKL